MSTFVIILQVIIAIILVVLMAVQTDKAEQGGVMGIGAAGGRSSSNIDMAVGAERILKPLTKWIAVGFLACSILSALPRITIINFLIVLAVYVLIMLYGNVVWRAVTGSR